MTCVHVTLPSFLLSGLSPPSLFPLPSFQPYLNEARQQMSEGNGAQTHAEPQPLGTSSTDSATLPQPSTALPHNHPHVSVPVANSSGGHQLESGSEHRALPQGWHSDGAMNVDPTYNNIPHVEKQPGVGVAYDVIMYTVIILLYIHVHVACTT